jgi:hypothetical protein
MPQKPARVKGMVVRRPILDLLWKSESGRVFLQSYPQRPANLASRAFTPLLVRPKAAWKMLAAVTREVTSSWSAGELDSFKDGSSRKITVESIHRYIERHLKD